MIATLRNCTCADVVLFIKYFVSTLFVLYSVALTIYGISLDYNITNFGSPLVEFLLLIVALILLAANEGYQVAALGISNLSEDEIREKGFKRAAACHHMLYHNGSKIKRLLIGQSFFVVLCTFTIARLTTFEYFPEDGIPEAVLDVFITGGLPGILICITFAQLLPSTLAQQYPLEFLEIPGIYYVIKAALVFESTGLVQFTYTLVWIFDKLFCRGANQPLLANNLEAGNENGAKDQGYQLSSEESELPKSLMTRILESDKLLYFKAFVSFCVTMASVGFIIYCVSMHYSASHVPIAGQFFMLFFAMTLGFYCEGLKVAIVSTAHVKDPNYFSEQGYPRAAQLSQLLSSVDEGVKRFLLGRQQIVVPLGFIVAQVTSFDRYPIDGMDPFSYGVIIDVGLPGILVLLQFAQLCPQLLAESKPLPFMSLFGSFSLARVALVLESFGLTKFVWILFAGCQRLFCVSNRSKTISAVEKPDSNAFMKSGIKNPLLLPEEKPQITPAN